MVAPWVGKYAGSAVQNQFLPAAAAGRRYYRARRPPRLMDKVNTSIRAHKGLTKNAAASSTGPIRRLAGRQAAKDQPQFQAASLDPRLLATAADFEAPADEVPPRLRAGRRQDAARTGLQALGYTCGIAIWSAWCRFAFPGDPTRNRKVKSISLRGSLVRT